MKTPARGSQMLSLVRGGVGTPSRTQPHQITNPKENPRAEWCYSPGKSADVQIQEGVAPPPERSKQSTNPFPTT
jgi:hypothetical protein